MSMFAIWKTWQRHVAKNSTFCSDCRKVGLWQDYFYAAPFILCFDCYWRRYPALGGAVKRDRFRAAKKQGILFPDDMGGL